MENREWKTYLLSDISSKIGDGLHGTPKYDGNGDYYFINGNNLINGSIVFKEDTKTVTEEEFLKYRKDLNDNSVLISINGTIGNLSFYRNEKVVLGKSAAYVNLLDTVDKKFVYYNFKSKFFQNYLVDIATGTTIPNVPLKGLREYEIQLPQLPEQKAIASVLSSLDDKIDLLHQQNQTLEALAETLFRQWFIEEAKEEWEEVKLKKVVDIAIGRTPPRKESQWFSTNNQDVKWISIKDLGSEGAFIFNTNEYLTNEAVVKFNIPIIPKDTVLLSFKMTVGRVAITTEEMLSNEAIAHFRFNDKTPFTKEYLYLFLKNYKYETLGSTSSIVTSINSAMIKDMEITIPDESTMRNFNEVAYKYFNKIKENSKQIQTLTQLRDTLLPKLMSGEVRVKN